MKDIQKIGIYRDGGTIIYIEPSVKTSLKTIEDAENCQKYYLDGRFGSETKGELFDKYPKDENAKMLDKSEFNFLEE